MPAPSPELTLIVAATARNMGIGLAGDLPWAGLRKEMAYFARVTKRAPQPGDSSNPNVRLSLSSPRLLCPRYIDL